MMINLGEIASFVNGKAFKPSDWTSSGKPIIRIQNLTDDSKTYNYFKGECEERYQVQSGDILISWSASLGIYEWKGSDAVLNQHIYKVVFDKKEVDKNYFKYVVGNVLKNVDRFIHGSTMKHIIKNDFDNLKVPLPDLKTQKQIAEILDKSDALRQQDKKIIEKYDLLTQSVFLDMFGDPVSNPKGWEKGPTINYSDCIVPGRDKPKSFTGDIPWVTTEDLVKMDYTSNSKKGIGLTNNEIAEVKAKVIPKNSVIMTCVGDLGVVSINSTRMVVNQQLHTFQCNNSLLPVFLMYNSSFQTPYMYKMASDTTVPYMNKTICNNTPSIVPPIELQNRFAVIVEKIQKQKQLAQKSLEKSEQLFQSLLQKAFKGELV